MGLCVVDEGKGDVFFVKSCKTAGDLVVLTLGLGGDSHGVAGIGHLKCRKLDLVLGIAYGIAGLPFHLADGNDIAAAGFLDLGGLLAADGVESAELVGAGSTDVAQREVGGDLAGNDLYKAVFAELIGNGLENKAANGLCGLILRSRNVIADCLQDSLGADVCHCCAADNGNYAALCKAGLKTDNDLFVGKLHGVEELFHKLFGNGSCLHKLHAHLFDLVCVGSRDSDLCGLAALGLVSGAVNEVDNAGAVRQGDHDRADGCAVFLFKCRKDSVEIAVLFVDLGDVEHCGNACGLEVFPASFRSNGDAVLSRAEDDAGLNNADSGENVADEVKVTRAVENIDLAAAEVYGSDGSCNCDLTLDFFGVIVADGISVGDLAHTVDSAGREQHALSKAGLTAVAVTHEADVADVFGFVAHVLLPLLKDILKI